MTENFGFELTTLLLLCRECHNVVLLFAGDMGVRHRCPHCAEMQRWERQQSLQLAPLKYLREPHYTNPNPPPIPLAESTPPSPSSPSQAPTQQQQQQQPETSPDVDHDPTVL